MSLSFADYGVNYIVKSISAKEKLKSHLNDLGFVAGATISVISENGGNLIVSVKDSRIAIDQSLANRILLES